MKSCSPESVPRLACGSSRLRIPNIRLCVCSLENVSVEKVKMTPAQRTTRSHARKRKYSELFHLIVGRLAGDDDVVHVALAQPGGGDADKPAVLLQFAKIGRSAISHAAAQAAGELIDEAA